MNNNYKADLLIHMAKKLLNNKQYVILSDVYITCFPEKKGYAGTYINNMFNSVDLIKKFDEAGLTLRKFLTEGTGQGRWKRNVCMRWVVHYKGIKIEPTIKKYLYIGTYLTPERLENKIAYFEKWLKYAKDVKKAGLGKNYVFVPRLKRVGGYYE